MILSRRLLLTTATTLPLSSWTTGAEPVWPPGSRGDTVWPTGSRGETSWPVGSRDGTSRPSGSPGESWSSGSPGESSPAGSPGDGSWPGGGEAVGPVVPVPGGLYRVGRADLHLVDRDRRDPWYGQVRELMVTLFYPTTSTRPRGTYLSPGMAEIADDFYTRRNLGMPAGTVPWTSIRPYARPGATPLRRRLPVVLFHAQHLDLRTYGTTLVEELASRGYLVVAMESPHEAFGVEFPGKRVVPSVFASENPPPPDPRVLSTLRTADIHFVLDELTRRYPGRFRLDRVGFFGQVGAAGPALQARYEGDRRIAAVAGLTDLIGTAEDNWVDVVHHGVPTPFLLISSVEDPGNRLNNPGWRQFWPKLKGWKLNLELAGSRWKAFGDYVWFAHQVPGLPPESLRQLIGTMDRPNALAAQRAYLTAFFSLHLGLRPPSHPDHDLLRRPSRRFPELGFV